MSLSHLAQYFREREALEVLETEWGFVAYQFLPPGEAAVYIVQIYVMPEHRKSGIASALADQVVEIAKGKGCKLLWGSVCPDTRGATTSVKVLLAYGFELAGINHQKNLVMFRKEI